MIQNLLSRVDITADATPDYIQFPVGLEDDDRIALVVAPGYNANLSFSTKAADAPKVDVPDDSAAPDNYTFWDGPAANAPRFAFAAAPTAISVLIYKLRA